VKIVVLVKEVPDTYGPRRLDLTTGLADRAASDAVVDEICERALEVALTHADANGGVDVVALAMSPASSEKSLRKALAMGADEAVLVADPELAGADVVTTAQTLAAAIQRIGFDLVIAGDRSTDGAGGVVPAMIAEFLSVPHATALSDVTVTATAVSGSRTTGTAVTSITAELPAVISITEALPEARVPSMKENMAARRKPLEQLTLADLDVPADATRGHSVVTAVAERPPRATGVKITDDDGRAAERLVAFLAEAKAL
jgi:electron transfer flavoprotein beta subunit